MRGFVFRGGRALTTSREQNIRKVRAYLTASVFVGSAVAVGAGYVWNANKMLHRIETEGFVKLVTRQGTGPVPLVGETVDVVCSCKVLGSGEEVFAEQTLKGVRVGVSDKSLPNGVEFDRMIQGMKRGERAICMFVTDHGEKRAWHAEILT